MSNVYLGQIIQGGWNFAPYGFHACDGSLLPISQNTALFSLLGTSFGGNGVQTFGLPDLRGRTMIGTGQGPGLSSYVIGETTGSENTTLTLSNLPAHTHPATFNSSSSLSATTVKATLEDPAAGTLLAHSTDGANPANAKPEIYAPAGSTPIVALGGLNVAGTVAIGVTGNGVPVSTLQPLQVVTIVIALQGIFPSRN